MAIVRRLLRYLRPSKKARYNEEVLYAGWVQPALPPMAPVKRR